MARVWRSFRSVNVFVYPTNRLVLVVFCWPLSLSILMQMYRFIDEERSLCLIYHFSLPPALFSMSVFFFFFVIIKMKALMIFALKYKQNWLTTSISTNLNKREEQQTSQKCLFSMCVFVRSTDQLAYKLEQNQGNEAWAGSWSIKCFF